MRAELVIDLWGGHRDLARRLPWQRDTIVNVWSTTKMVAALCALMLHDRGEISVDAPLAEYWPEFAANGKEGLAKARADKPDLICLDITMPEESGVRFFRNLKEDPELASIPVVVVTAVTGYGRDPESFRKFISTRKQVPPPEGFFSKPIDREEFLAKVEELLD